MYVLIETIVFQAYHTFGQAGKLVVEISIIGFLIGTLIAFLVVMGDLGPEIMADVFNVENSASLRTIIMTGMTPSREKFA